LGALIVATVNWTVWKSLVGEDYQARSKIGIGISGVQEASALPSRGGCAKRIQNCDLASIAAGMYPVAVQKPTVRPLEGTWKLNAARSEFAPNHATAPKEETMVLRVVGDQFELTDSGTQKDGAAIAGKDASPMNGGVFKVLQAAPAEGESYVETILEPGNRFLPHG
jgi:hypothetical protein